MASVFRALGEGIADLSQLQVQTFTGDLTAFIDTSADTSTPDQPKKSLIQWDKLLEEAKNKGAVSLVAATKVNFDGDTELFVATNAPQTLVAAHNTAVASAQQLRQGLVDTFRDLLGLG